MQSGWGGRQTFVSNAQIESLVTANFVERLTELEAAVEKKLSTVRFYTPSAPVIGLNATTGMAHHYSGPTILEQRQFAQHSRSDEAETEEAEEGFIDEYQDMESDGSDGPGGLEELEDSTGSPP